MKTLHVKQVDAFTTKPFTGNYAGVVPDANGLTDEEMQNVAREMNLPETAFVLRPTIPGTDLQIRWFTPSAEVPLCGHATIASFHALAEEGLEGMKANGQHYFRLQTKSGILAVRVEKNFHGISVEFELPLPKFSLKKKLPAQVFQALGMTKKDMDTALPVVANAYLYIPVKRLAVVQKLQPNFSALIKISKALKVLGICTFTLETVEKTSAVHSRFFAPAVGIPEDPVTGSANGPLGVYLCRYALPAGYAVPCRELADDRIEYCGEQGDEIGRPGRVKIKLKYHKDKIQNVSIAGEAVTVFSGTLTMQYFERMLAPWN